MKKILVLGSGGSGKTTFALQLGKKLDLPLYHLDALYWKPNREKPSEAEWNQKITELLAKDHWIIDGSYFNTLPYCVFRQRILFYFWIFLIISAFGIF